MSRAAPSPVGEGVGSTGDEVVVDPSTVTASSVQETGLGHRQKQGQKKIRVKPVLLSPPKQKVDRIIAYVRRCGSREGHVCFVERCSGAHDGRQHGQSTTQSSITVWPKSDNSSPKRKRHAGTATILSTSANLSQRNDLDLIHGVELTCRCSVLLFSGTRCSTYIVWTCGRLHFLTPRAPCNMAVRAVIA